MTGPGLVGVRSSLASETEPMRTSGLIAVLESYNVPRVWRAICLDSKRDF